jgi:hypothetical protein
VQAPAVSLAPPPTDADAVSASDAAAAEKQAADAAAIDAMLVEAKDMTERGHLFAPKGKNAAERYLAALRADPTRRDTTRAIENLFAPLATATSEAIDHGDVDAAEASMDRTLSLADAAKLRKSKAFETYRTTVRDAIARRRQQGHGVFDAGLLTPLAALVPTLEKLDAHQAETLRADLDRPAKLLRVGGKFRDRAGPELAVIPAETDVGDHLEYAYALGVTDVTRSAYERFAKATGRPPTRCRESQSLFARSKNLSWSAPGFTQTDDDPVVCISWQDAKAYTDWLSRQTGEHYRLPTQQEWLHVAQAVVVASGCGNGNFSTESCDDGYANTAPVGRFPPTRYGLYDVIGNVAIWTADCAEPSGGECKAHAIRGLSWRDERDPAQVWREAQSAADVGYTTIGFRVLREVSADNAQLAKH